MTKQLKTKIEPINTGLLFKEERPKVRNWANYRHGELPTDLHNPKGESQTIPDMALSLNELLSRHTRGMAIPQKNPVYNEDLPDFDKMDLTELAEYKEQNLERIREIQAQLAANEATRQRQKAAELPSAPVPPEQSSETPSPKLEGNKL